MSCSNFYHNITLQWTEFLLFLKKKKKVLSNCLTLANCVVFAEQWYASMYGLISNPVKWQQSLESTCSITFMYDTGQPVVQSVIDYYS